jgi:hypothetical protein
LILALDFNTKGQRQNRPDKWIYCDQQVIADQNHAINDYAIIHKSSFRDLAYYKQVINSLVHLLNAAGAICTINGYAIKKMN